MDIRNCTPKYWMENVDVCMENLRNNWNSIKLLNANSIEYVGNNSLVRFRGMVQDMYNPEYYYERYEVVNDVTKEKEIRCGRYQDAAILGDKEYINNENQENITAERNTFVVITIPALNEWSKSIEKEMNRCDVPITNNARSKRTIDDSDSMEVDVTPDNKNKRIKCTTNINRSETGCSVLSKDYVLNFPIPIEDGTTCLIKVYENSNTIKLNEMYEFVGFLTINPLTFANNDDDDNDEIDLEMQMHNPPTSLVPRIHCVSCKALEHNNPLLNLQDIGLYNNKEKMCAMYKELRMLFTQLLFGDSLAASYVIYHLLSEVYLRRDMTPLGKFALNISNVPSEIENYAEKFYKFIAQLATKSYYLSMTLENLNTLTFTPKKDYECNRLTSGLLQLSKNTHLILDETKLKEGKLNEAGVRSISSITDVINNQSVKYEFVYYQMEYECDIPILVISEGKSMLPSDYHVRLQPNDEHVNTFEEICTAIEKLLNTEVLNNLRIYLTAVRFSEYNMSDQVQETIQNEFVNLRRENNCSVTDLHQLLVLARLICMAEGETNLNDTCWKKALQLERERKERL